MLFFILTIILHPCKRIDKTTSDAFARGEFRRGANRPLPPPPTPLFICSSRNILCVKTLKKASHGAQMPIFVPTPFPELWVLPLPPPEVWVLPLPPPRSVGSAPPSPRSVGSAPPSLLPPLGSLSQIAVFRCVCSCHFTQPLFPA